MPKLESVEHEGKSKEYWECKMCSKRVERQQREKGSSININADTPTVTLVVVLMRATAFRLRRRGKREKGGGGDGACWNEDRIAEKRKSHGERMMRNEYGEWT